jgi:hypothetical protein
MFASISPFDVQNALEQVCRNDEHQCQKHWQNECQHLPHMFLREKEELSVPLDVFLRVDCSPGNQ